MAAPTSLLDRMLDAVGRALTPESARRLLDIRADGEAQRRIDDLAERSSEGSLTLEEQGEYEALVAAANLIAILQAKARAALTANPAA